ncbi:aryl hydrocarbon receptor 2 [Brachyhypopomus gauderio]|uniref:aryl hydrocarbon receptor 2 n=1 Tax=Brachyhypopomus gauderio TaxID=698409 RepID=UPI00404351A3
MLGSGGTYASKKRKKPVQKIPKPPPPEGAKSNPSKRHRDRLNMELDKLTNLLPFSEDVRSRLDKLSVLRLSVGYLKVKSFFSATMKKNVGGAGGWPMDRTGTFGGNGQIISSLDGVNFSEGELLLQALNGFVLVITAEGYVFYSSSTIQDYLGFHQSDVVHQSVFELIHTDDRATFRRQLHFALNPVQSDLPEDNDGLQNSSDITSNIISYNPQQLPPENSSFLERSFCCRFRCLLDNSSGFLALNFQGRLKYLHGQNKMAEDGTITHPQLALFAIATPLQSPSILEIRSKTLLFQTKHKLDFTPMGIDTRGKVVLGYTEIELCMRGTGYQFIHAADMMYCADNHLRMIKTGESGLTVFRLLSKSGTWIWVQANARLVFKGGRPDFIVARQRALTNEEGDEHLRQRKLQLPFSFATGEAVLYETGPLVNMGDMGPGQSSSVHEPPAMGGPNSMMNPILKQDQSVYKPNEDPNIPFSLEKAFQDSHALLTVPSHSWQPAPVDPAVAADAKEEMQEMMESLQQIIGDSNLCGDLGELEVDQQELKDWENTLLRISSLNSGEMPVELNDIVADDIFSYVEDMLYKEGMAGQTEQLPGCLADLQLKGSLGDFEGRDGGRGPGAFFRDGVDKGGMVGGRTLKLTHLGPEMALGQQEMLQDEFMDPLMNLTGFRPVPGPQQNQARLTQHRGAAQQSALTAGAQSHTQATNRVYSESIDLPNLQNQAQPMGFHNHNSLSVNQPVRPSNQWEGPVSSGDTNTWNVSLSQDVPLNPTTSSSLQHLPKRSPVWPSPQPPVQQGLTTMPSVPKIPNIPNGPTVPNVPSARGGHSVLYSQPTDVQQDPFTQLLLQNNFGSVQQSISHPRAANTAYGQQEEFMHSAANSVYVQQESLMQPCASAVYGQQGEMRGNSSAAPTSCMFDVASQGPVNGMRYAPVGSDAVISTCQNTKGFGSQNLPQGSCFYQSGLGENLVNSMALPAEGATISTVPSHRILGTDNLLQQQQFLACNGQTQVRNHPIKNGTFQVPTQSCFTNSHPNKDY